MLSFSMPAAELVLLFVAALLNRSAADRFLRYRQFELVGLVVLWYLVLLAGALLGGIVATPEG